MLHIFLGAGLFLLSILFRLAAALRLTVPLLYALVVPTLLHGWYYSHQALAVGLWRALLGLSLLSWASTFVRRLRQHRRDKAQTEALSRQLHEAGQTGETSHVDDL